LASWLPSPTGPTAPTRGQWRIAWTDPTEHVRFEDFFAYSEVAGRCWVEHEPGGHYPEARPIRVRWHLPAQPGLVGEQRGELPDPPGIDWSDPAFGTARAPEGE
jgi:hypothetical protein